MRHRENERERQREKEREREGETEGERVRGEKLVKRDPRPLGSSFGFELVKMSLLVE